MSYDNLKEFSTMPRRPAFICIGAQKTGTTWLYKLLSKHPEVWMPKGRKEVHYFDREVLRRPISWYEQLFDDSTGATTIAGEKTPNYAHLKPRSIAFVRALVPNVKIILILRRPDERAWSQARMETSQYNKRELGPRDLKRCIFQLGLIRNSQLTRYDRMLLNWRQCFSDDQILLLFYEEIEETPDATLQKVSRFLEIADFAGSEGTKTQERVWKSPTLEMPNAVRWYLQRKYRSMVKSLAKSHPERVNQWLMPAPDELKTTIFERLRVWFIADVCTIPYNVAYWCYDSIRDLRMSLRLRTLSRQLARSPRPEPQWNRGA